MKGDVKQQTKQTTNHLPAQSWRVSARFHSCANYSTERERDRQTDRQTETESDRETERERICAWCVCVCVCVCESVCLCVQACVTICAMRGRVHHSSVHVVLWTCIHMHGCVLLLQCVHDISSKLLSMVETVTHCPWLSIPPS